MWIQPSDMFLDPRCDEAFDGTEKLKTPPLGNYDLQKSARATNIRENI